MASEVKNLAMQTAKATDEIGGQIAAVQSATRAAVNAIGTIAGTIGNINEISSSIASAVEEQNAVTREMSGNMQTAAEGVENISRSINEIARSTGMIDGATRKVREASQAIA